MGDLSRSFSTWEFTVDGRRGDRRPPAVLIRRLQTLRDRIGRPLPIVSWYRSPTYNRAMGGARRSWHLSGLAVDIPPRLVSVDQARAAGFTGIGVRNGWVVHLDVRPGAVTVFDDP